MTQGGAPLRLDQALVARGLADSRARARALIAEGAVSVDGAPERRPARKVGAAAALAVAPARRWVGRGALKLLHAMAAFGLSPRGASALDLGASTGGFTEVLLAEGAAAVTALDVGRGQLHPSLRVDPRVTVVEGVNARELRAGEVPPFDWITADLSFISLRTALPAALALAPQGATLIALVKPQFEAGRAAVGKGGIVRDPSAHAAACDAVAAFLREAGWDALGLTRSPIAGGDGNVEFLIAARKR
ncbi:MAG: TlyA family RNA methyltransferase [Rubrimonas sp.]|uniref:TlyA family RNA methyltransferase n=1 Tax=Rubrimonas sp. TaxID=2036015 RepID=UPI002FDC942E